MKLYLFAFCHLRKMRIEKYFTDLLFRNKKPEKNAR